MWNMRLRFTKKALFIDDTQYVNFGLLRSVPFECFLSAIIKGWILIICWQNELGIEKLMFRSKDI